MEREDLIEHHLKPIRKIKNLNLTIQLYYPNIKNKQGSQPIFDPQNLHLPGKYGGT